MPAFSFEKIQPPVAAATVRDGEASHHGAIVQFFDRIAESQIRRQARALSRADRHVGPGEESASNPAPKL